MIEEILAKIKSRGYWFVVIRPVKFEEKRIRSLGECEELVRKCAVSLRGWNYPHYGRSKSGIDYVESVTDWECYKELWRMYQSGQFVHFFSCREDWWHESSSRYVKKAKPGSVLSVLSTLYSITEIYEFASRLAQKDVFDSELYISIKLHGMRDRRLIILEPMRLLFRDYICAVDDLPLPPKKISVERILGRGHDLALDDTIWIFERFNWHSPPRGILKEEQKKLLERRL